MCSTAASSPAACSLGVFSSVATLVFESICDSVSSSTRWALDLTQISYRDTKTDHYLARSHDRDMLTLRRAWRWATSFQWRFCRGFFYWEAHLHSTRIWGTQHADVRSSTQQRNNKLVIFYSDMWFILPSFLYAHRLSFGWLTHFHTRFSCFIIFAKSLVLKLFDAVPGQTCLKSRSSIFSVYVCDDCVHHKYFPRDF